MNEGKLSLESKDIAEEKRQGLLRLFPEAETEGGKIDFDQLKRALGESVDTGRERYGMNWPGKADCFRLIQSPSTATLLPARQESVRFDETENMIIEGDNLEVLKLLQKGYQNKIKTIYIDPPYNTGNDFIYPDDFTDSLKNYLQYTGQVDAEDKRFSNNLDTDGRFHTKWLNMMYPRLYLARNLMRDDGLIFISIDDTEIDNLKKLCNEIFGEQNFVEQMVWKNKLNSGAMTTGFSNVHEYILCYSRIPGQTILSPLGEEAIASHRGRDSKYPVRGGYVTQPLATGSRDHRPNLIFPISIEGKEVWPDKQWLWSRDRVALALANDELVLNESDGVLNVRVKQYLRDEKGRLRKTKPLSITIGPYNQEGSKEIKDLLGKEVFGYPKPKALLKKLFSITTSEFESNDGIVLDFTAGSGTSAHAVLEHNRENGNVDSFILVQLPEPTGRQDYRTIADITKERVRRVIQREDEETAKTLDLQPVGMRGRKEGFRVFKLAPSNFKVWDAHTDEGLQGVERQMELAVNHIMPDRSAEDLFYEILMKSEYPLTAKVESFDAAGIAAYSVEDDALIVCVERKVTPEAVAAIAKRKPSKVIFLDEAFSGNDQLKANAKMNFESAGVKRFETV